MGCVSEAGDKGSAYSKQPTNATVESKSSPRGGNKDKVKVPLEELAKKKVKVNIPSTISNDDLAAAVRYLFTESDSEGKESLDVIDFRQFLYSLMRTQSRDPPAYTEEAFDALV